MPLPGMLAEVTRTRVKGPLQQRQPEILEDIPELLPVFEGRVRGAAVQVVLLTGLDPIPGAVRDLAVEAITLQTASAIEYADYPEQQVPGSDGRGYHLHQRYLELLEQLRVIINNAGGQVPPDDALDNTTGGPSPVGSFPCAPAPYPDPVERPGTSWSSWC